MKKFLLILSSVWAISGLQAQSTTYTVTNAACDTTFGTGTSVSLMDDVHSAPVSIGFPFCFYGNTYDSLLIGSNSCLSFNLALAGTYKPFSVPAIGTTTFATQLYNTIQGPLHDLNPATGGTVRYYTTGVPPYRTFVVEYDHVPYFGAANNAPFSGKIKLFETTNVIEVHVIDRPAATSTATNAMLGLIPIQNSANAPTFANNYWGAWTAYHQAVRFEPYGLCSNPSSYNLITGHIFFDMNTDCANNGTDFPLGGQLVVANGGQRYTYTDQYGNYALVVDTGAYVVEHVPMTLHHVLCPAAGYTTSFSTLGNTTANFDFADSAQQCVNFNVDIAASWQRLCRNNHVYVHYTNNGTIPSGTSAIHVILPDSTYFISSNPAPSSIAGNVLTYNIGTLLPNQTGTIVMIDSVDCAATMGTQLLFQADIVPNTVNEECDTLGNLAIDPAPIVASWDPNDIRALSQTVTNGYVFSEDIAADDELTYMIRFQNMGNDTAFNVRVVEMLPAELNHATIVPGASSHQYTFFRYGNEIRFIFNDIMLPYQSIDEAGSHGFVKFRVLQRDGNQPGTVINTMANIYFDTNPAVPTNDAVLTIPFPNGTGSLLNNSALQIAPNPAQNTLNVQWMGTERAQLITIYDALGRVMTSTNYAHQIALDNLTAGVYFIQVETENGSVLAMQRFVKQ